MTPSLTEDQAYAALGAFLDAILTGVDVVRGQVNRVPMPSGPNWISMQAMGRDQMATTERSYTPNLAPAPAVGSAQISRSTILHFNLDVYGPAGADNAQAITTLFADDYGADFFRARGLGALYCEQPAQMPLIAGEQQYIGRWMIRCALHGNIVFGLPQEFADTVITTLSEITHGI